ncbi:lysophospholipid acyltransferase family protein [Synoicihabitans lomoniglobus]|uniref:Lysophospholipid acyltransferase family protein n=1 Tax=Synoicihabitans lomoniglobus TaxID=2909285 RepID=A0AAF0CMP8_9BACT|nr:1-acyl-sn-glycerol-3-phosphate acyltransferase [Opitutaceae bacterium LMO-M01]WED64458.1 lysophospholipid acyltransferase family protein [Opitutaceae bacterium LMO-M01]
MTFRRRLLRLYHYPANIVSWTMFAAVGLALNAVCAPLLLVRRRPSDQVRRTIKSLFVGWCKWLHATRLIYVRFHGFTPEAMTGPAVYIANHPGLLDATFILSQLPDTICIFKPEIIRNPVLGPAARMAGYVSGTNGVDLIRDVAAKVEAGRSLLIFPEGTRTAAHVDLNPLRPGFALIAARARVPVRLILVKAPRDLVPKGWSWWRAPSFPSHVDIHLLGELTAPEPSSAKALTELATRQFSAVLARHDTAFAHPSGSDSQL